MSKHVWLVVGEKYWRDGGDVWQWPLRAFTKHKDALKFTELLNAESARLYEVAHMLPMLSAYKLSSKLDPMWAYDTVDTVVYACTKLDLNNKTIPEDRPPRRLVFLDFASPLNGRPLVRRETGLFEVLCKHGVGHPVPESISYMDENGPVGARGSWGSHGCDGCCSDLGTSEPRAEG